MTETGLPDMLDDHFARQCQQTPHDVALVEGDRRVTFGQLGADVAILARGLVASGIRPGSMVGLHMERSVAWVASALAILRANAAVVPLPPSYPPARLADILRYAELDAVIEDGASRLDPALPGQRLSPDGLRSAASAGAEPGSGDPRQPAFVLCSSGSTGRPKMIVRAHRSFFHRLRWTWREHPYQQGEICCQKSHMTTTHAVYELFEPLLKGVPVLMVSDEDVRNLESFWDIIRAQRITRLLVVPSQLQASLALPGFVPPRLRVLVLMGEYLSPTLAEQALATFPASTHTYSIYGSTEASSTLVCDLRRWFRPGAELPLGHPIDPAVKPVVRSPDGESTAPGDIGRLYVGGPALFSGYFRDPDRTASVLLNVPDSDAPLFDTGDDVRLTADGQLEFVGRADQTIKVRGYRIDLREVEHVLLQHPDVRQAVVIGRSGAGGVDRLVAFVSPASVDHSGVYRTLRDRLPEYMVPSVLTVLDQLPLTPSGKVDRRQLLAEDHYQTVTRPTAGDLSTTAQRVAAVWAQVLGDAVPAPDVSFFEAGGTSLSVFSLVHRLREEFQLDRDALDARTVYRSPTIADLAAHLDQVRMSGRGVGPTTTPLLVTLRRGVDRERAPVFLIASAGGALGSYQKLARALRTSREIIGVRDPLIWGQRDPTAGFADWVGRYLQAIRARQPGGPYYIGAYSSAGAFGYEIARRLREANEEVALLLLIDPLGIDRRTRGRYGWWVLWSTYAPLHIRLLTRLAGSLRWKWLGRTRFFSGAAPENLSDPLPQESTELMREARRDRSQVLALSALLELNTGVHYTLEASALDGVAPEQYLAVLQNRVRTLTPEVEPEEIERILMQYPLQVRAQHLYRLRPYDGRVLLIEAATRYAGLLRAQFRPYVRRLEARSIRLAEPSERVRSVAARFGALSAHFLSMRDHHFVEALAKELDAHLA